MDTMRYNNLVGAVREESLWSESVSRLNLPFDLAGSSGNVIEIDVVCPFRYVVEFLRFGELPDEKSVRPAIAYLRVSTRGASRSVNLFIIYQFAGGFL